MRTLRGVALVFVNPKDSLISTSSGVGFKISKECKKLARMKCNI
jgi:hypothetical protein